MFIDCNIPICVHIIYSFDLVYLSRVDLGKYICILYLVSLFPVFVTINLLIFYSGYLFGKTCPLFSHEQLEIETRTKNCLIITIVFTLDFA